MSDSRVRRSRLFRATPRRHPDAGTSFGSQAAHDRQTVSEPDVRMSRRYGPAAPPSVQYQSDGYGARQERLEVSPNTRAYRHGVSPRSAGRGQGTPTSAGRPRTACRRTESALRARSVGLAVGHAGGTTLSLETSVVPQNGAPEHRDRITGGELLERAQIGISLLVKACGRSCWLESRSAMPERAVCRARERQRDASRAAACGTDPTAPKLRRGLALGGFVKEIATSSRRTLSSRPRAPATLRRHALGGARMREEQNEAEAGA